MNKEELKTAVEKAYVKGYREGFGDACDTIMVANYKAMIDLVVDMKKSVKETKAEVIIDEYKEEE